MTITLFKQKCNNARHRHGLKKQPISTKARKNSKIFIQAKTKSLMTVINTQIYCLIKKPINTKVSKNSEIFLKRKTRNINTVIQICLIFLNKKTKRKLLLFI